MYTEAEISYLMNQHSVEYAAGPRCLAPMVDLRTMGCPARIFEKVLESRARKLGKAFAEFRTANRPAATDLDLAISSSKLF